MALHAFRLVDMAKIGMVKNVYANKDMPKLVEYADLAHQRQFQMQKKLHACVQIHYNISFHHLMLVSIVQQIHPLIMMILIVSVNLAILSKMANVYLIVHQMLFQLTMVNVHVLTESYGMEINVLLLLLALIDLLSILTLDHVFATVVLRTLLMEFVRLAVKTAFGIMDNVFAQLASLKLQDNAEHAILELNMMEKTVYAI